MKRLSLLIALAVAAPAAAQFPIPRFGGARPEAPPPTGPQPPTAMEAVAAFKAVTGRTKLTGVVEIRGTGGAPTPGEWVIVVHDPASPTRLGEFVVRGPRVDEPRACQLYYPKRAPEGYFDYGKVTVDSLAAFKAADREAGIARIGFDFIDYRLRCREFSDDPIWDLTLRTADGVALGTVSISNKTGRVLRTVWMRPAARGALVIGEDSAEPGARPLDTQVPIPEKAPAPPAPGDPTAPPPDDPATAPDNSPLPPPPPLPPPGSTPPVPQVTPD